MDIDTGFCVPATAKHAERAHQTTLGAVWFFGDLSPLVRGYVRAMLTTAAPGSAYKDLAPETLERVLDICSAVDNDACAEDDGAELWEQQSRAGSPRPYVDVNGKVRLS